MTCEFGTSLALLFQKSGIEAYPTELDLRSKARQFAHGRATFGESAGQVIGQSYIEAEPVIVSYDGEYSHRLYIPSDSIEFRRQLDRPTTAHVELHDAIQILERGTIEKSFGEASVGEVIDYIFEHRDDPSDVLTGYRFTTEEERQQTKTAVDITAGVDVGLGIDYVFDVPFEFKEENIYRGFEFDGISPLDALTEVLNEYNLDYRVENDGTVVFGTFGQSGNVFTVSDDESDFQLSQYNVTTSANRTNAVRLRGSYITVPEAGSLTAAAGSAKLRPIAEATAGGLTGDALQLEAKGVDSLSQLQNIATRALIQELMDDVNGNLVIDALATEDNTALAELAVGDNLIVTESIKEYCDANVVTGVFLVNSVHAKARQRTGWTINVDISQVAFPDAIQTETFFFDPATDQRFESLESYNEYQPEEQETDGYLPI